MTSTSGSFSRACASRPPQNVLSPVMSTRRPTRRPLSEPDAAPLAQHLVEVVLQADPDGLGLVHDPTARVPLLVGRDVEVHGVEYPQPELRREVADQPKGT